MKFALITALYASSAAAVNILLYTAADCSGSGGACKNIDANMCCAFTDERAIKSAKFQKLKKNNLGGIFKKNKKTPCNKATAVIQGPGCLNGTGNGAGWVVPTSSGTKVAAVANFKCKRTVEADAVFFGDHHFDINARVPAEHVRELKDLVRRQATFEDIPGHLLDYEVEA